MRVGRARKPSAGDRQPAVTEVLAGATYRYQVAAADPDPGDQVSFEIDAARAGGMTINAGLIEWPAAVRNQTVSVRARRRRRFRCRRSRSP